MSGLQRALVIGAAAIVCVGLSARAAHVAWGESAYQAGLGYTDNPSRDLPGRLSHFEEALRRRPRSALYALRTAQIVLSRSRRSHDRAGLQRARSLLEAARDEQPLDARVRAVLAGAYRDVLRWDDALLEAHAAHRLAPRHRAIRSTVQRVALAAWTRAETVDGLRLALRVSAEDAIRSGSTAAPVTPAAAAEAIRRAGPRALADALEAAAGDARLLEAAAHWFDGIDAPSADVLRRAARRASERRQP